jgi:hypothetical protein
MHQDLIDLMIYYVYYKFLDDRNIYVEGLTGNMRDKNPTRTNA